MYLKLNCQNREQRQSIQDVALLRNSKGVVDRRRRSGVCEKRVQNGLKQVVTTMKIGEMQQQQKTNGCIWGCSMQRPLRIRAVDVRTLQQRCQIKISTMANHRTERSPGSARMVLRTWSIYNDNTRTTAFPLRLLTVWCCGGCGGQRHITGRGKGVTQLNARGHENEAPTCNTLEMTMIR
jgi:hypothetical protein